VHRRGEPLTGEHEPEADEGGEDLSAVRDGKPRVQLGEGEDAEDVVGARGAAGVAVRPPDRLLQRDLDVARQHEHGAVVRAGVRCRPRWRR
jgi:hypothetical protein